MSVRARYSIGFSVSSTSAEEKDLGNVKWEVVSDGYGEGGSRKMTLDAGAVDVQLAMGNVTDAALLIIRTNAKDPTQDPVEVRVRLNVITADQLKIVPLSGTKEGHMQLSTTGLTGLFASNPGAIPMEITVGVVGD